MAAKGQIKRHQIQVEVSCYESPQIDESGVEGNEESVRRLTKSGRLDRRSFRAPFYDEGLSPVQVMESLGLSAQGVGTLMRYHGIGAFGYGEVSDARIEALLDELSDEEGACIVE